MLKANRIEDHLNSFMYFHYKDPNAGQPTVGLGLVAERGGVVSLVSGTGPTTSSPDDVGNQVQYAVDPTLAKPVGVLMPDVVKYDTNRQWPNPYKGATEELVGRKVNVQPTPLLWTNMIDSGSAAPSPGAPAYLAANGRISTVQATSGTNGVNKAPQVGTFKSAGLDKDGYAWVKFAIV